MAETFEGDDAAGRRGGAARQSAVRGADDEDDIDTGEDAERVAREQEERRRARLVQALKKITDDEGQDVITEARLVSPSEHPRNSPYMYGQTIFIQFSEDKAKTTRRFSDTAWLSDSIRLSGSAQGSVRAIRAGYYYDGGHVGTCVCISILRFHGKQGLVLAIVFSCQDDCTYCVTLTSLLRRLDFPEGESLESTSKFVTRKLVSFLKAFPESCCVYKAKVAYSNVDRAIDDKRKRKVQPLQDRDENKRGVHSKSSKRPGQRFEQEPDFHDGGFGVGFGGGGFGGGGFGGGGGGFGGFGGGGGGFGGFGGGFGGFPTPMVMQQMMMMQQQHGQQPWGTFCPQLNYQPGDVADSNGYGDGHRGAQGDDGEVHDRRARKRPKQHPSGATHRSARRGAVTPQDDSTLRRTGASSGRGSRRDDGNARGSQSRGTTQQTKNGKLYDMLHKDDESESEFDGDDVDRDDDDDYSEDG